MGSAISKGIFNALEAFRLDHDSQGWRVSDAMDAAELLEYSIATGHDSPLDAQGGYPLMMLVTSEMLDHAEALHTLFQGEQSLMVPVRPTDSHAQASVLCGGCIPRGLRGWNTIPRWLGIFKGRALGFEFC